MGNFARRIIDAIQHSMLGSLLVRLLWPCGWLVWTVFDSLAPDVFDAAVGGSFLILLACGLFLIWLLGAVANRRPRSGRVLEGLQDPPDNGFAAWSELPAGGLRPPPLMRGLVTALGESPGHRRSWIGVIPVLVAPALAVSLAVAGSSFWQGVHPALGDPSNRLVLALVFTGMLAAFWIRDWASDQRKQLELPSANSA